MRKITTFVGLALLALAGTAHAQDTTTAPAADPMAPAPAGDAMVPAPAGDPMVVPAAVATTGSDYISRGLTVGANTLQVTLPVVLNLSKDAVLKPVWVPLDVRFGVTDQLEVFLTHNQTFNAPLAVGGGVCLGGKDNGCDKFYNNLNLGGQFSFLKDAGIELSALAGVEFRQLSDPMYLAIDVGVGFKYIAAPVSVKVTPTVGIGANKRDEGNKEYLSIPVQVAFQATPELALFVESGIFGLLDGFGDNYVVPAGVGAAFAVMPNLDVGAEFMMTRLVTGMSGDEAMDARTAMVFGTFRTK